MKQKLQLRDCKVVSVCPDRPNIAYFKKERPGDNFAGLETILQNLVEEMSEKGEDFPLTMVYTDLDSIQYSFRFMKHHLPPQIAYKGPVATENRTFAQYHKSYTEDMKTLIVTDLGKSTPTLKVVFATTALGMGLDAPHIRRIIHFKAPPSIEQYLQETGRAGRDGQPAEAIVHYNGRDLRSNRPGLSPAMATYCRSTEICLRSLLLTYLGYTASNDRSSVCCGHCSDN